ncbi:saccharopine dehydrogenase [Sinimarinibacterium sp. CAU 1509]|uniref:saccharopine dehydrogenase family protein n=1 Tax=Sinimarinibacterium sp. CAU 1509 TaxID=2562283 RepID=UPI0010AC7C7F|nr:saccharopine dehydrogenase NADP-binding domain-containing protein [Sinimarinibacterium sp. CAU 1509]TJY62260.1 saccharopine dehydrogenase [Sinimarinibacterium sp. CAU 1509]
MTDTPLQIVVFGATSFVGQILSRYLFNRYGNNGELRWAIAGRSHAKLAQLRSSLGAGAESLPIIVADAADESALEAMCASTRVVVSTVGPYALYGSPLVGVCAHSGTDYCDLTGEVQWIRRMIDAHEATARASGARIVHCCGFDSVPSDMGVHFLQRESMRVHGQPCTRVKLRIKAMRGGASGGTVASLMNVVREISADPEVRKLMVDPFAVCPDRGKGRPKQPEVRFSEFDPDCGSWLGPFVMAGINTRIVHRSNALSGDAYGHDFVYDEAMMTGPGSKGRMAAAGIALGLGGFVAAAMLPPARWVLERYVVPKPGEGPSPEAQANGFYDFRFYGHTADGQTVKVKVTGDRDPGYGSTAKILGEAAACLARDISKQDCVGGIWTPATAMGDRLIERLRAHAGLTFTVLD